MRCLYPLILLLLLFSCSKKVELESISKFNWHLQSEFKEVEKAVQLADGGYAVIGSAEGAPAVLIFNNDLSVRLYKSFKEYHSGRFNDLIEISSGGFVAVGYTMHDKNGGVMLNSTALAVQFTVSGEVQKDYRKNYGEYDHFGAVEEISNNELLLQGMASGNPSYVYHVKLKDMSEIDVVYSGNLNDRFYSSDLVTNSSGDELWFIRSVNQNSAGIIDWIVYNEINAQGILQVDYYSYINNNNAIYVSYNALNSETGIPRLEAIVNSSQNCTYSTYVSTSTQVPPEARVNDGIFICEMDFNGNVLWQEVIDVPGVFFESIIETKDGYIVSGSQRNKSTFSGDKQFFLLAVDKRGKELWRKVFGSTSDWQSILCAKSTPSGIELLGLRSDNSSNAQFAIINLNSKGEFE